jgi:hypothetical protein
MQHATMKVVFDLHFFSKKLDPNPPDLTLNRESVSTSLISGVGGSESVLRVSAPSIYLAAGIFRFLV